MRAAFTTSLLFAAALAAGCTSHKTTDDSSGIPTGTGPCQDDDGDGFCVDPENPDDPVADCNDADANVFPGATDTCNGVDDNCNGLTDEGNADADADGVCDSMDTETCDGVDNNGDGVVDEGFGDSDGDGLADCVDGEVCDGIDNNGDGRIDEGYDADGDGYTQCGDGSGGDVDCDDSSASVHPGASEKGGDLLDNDCDGLTDEADWSAGAVFITEIMNNPAAVADPNGEWFEIYNGSGHEVVLNGVVITNASGTSYHQITGDNAIVVAAGSYFVLGSSDDLATNGDATVDYVYDGVSLGNEADDIELWVDDPETGNLEVDAVSWDTSWPSADGASMTLDPDFNKAADNDDPANWCPAPSSWATLSDDGSPSAVNDPCSTIDHDGDGYSVDDGDCNDADDTVYPGAPSISSTVDNDCDGVIDLGPTGSAKVASGSSTQQCGVVTLDASGTSDKDTPITYSWELVSAPAGSALTTSDMNTSTSQKPTFIPDVAGTYTFSMTAYDSYGESGAPVSLAVTISARSTNHTPTADAGSSQSTSGSTTCTALSYGTNGYDCGSCSDATFTLDGTGSKDTDGDSLTYAWTVTSGSGSLDDSTKSQPTLTVAGPAGDHSASVTETVDISLKVTDCMGTTSSADTVAVSYTCTAT